MLLRGIDFGSIFFGSGAIGFFGEGYWYHKYCRVLFPGLFTFKGITFVSKTTTAYKREGNLPLEEDHLTPLEVRPRCIWVNPWTGDALNAVGLSGPGVGFLLAQGRWQMRKKPFVISFMAVGKTFQERIEETRFFVKAMLSAESGFKARFAVEVNISCPNVGFHCDELVAEVNKLLDILSVLDVPLIVKLNASTPFEVAVRISQYPSCDAICISNTLPWRSVVSWLPADDYRQIKWNEVFGPDEKSPLQKRGFKEAGGLSGPRLFPIVAEWIIRARASGLQKPIIGGGGVFSSLQVKQLHGIEASACYVSTVCLFRPWRLRGIISRAHKLWKGE